MGSKGIISLEEVKELLGNRQFPISGITELGSAEFSFTGLVPCLGVALHAGGRVRPGLRDIMEVSGDDRHREEDPHTDRFIENLPLRVRALDSRFEYDLNREPERSIYSSVRVVWGLKVWKRKINEQERALSLAKHGEFHQLIDMITGCLLQEYKRILVFDMHSYCYQREKKQAWHKDPRPGINVGTKAVNRKLFGPVINRLISELSGLRIDNRPFRVAENEIFPGGYLSRRLSREHYDRVLVLALEYKKVFMDEWTGQVYPGVLELLVRDFEQAVEKLLGEFCDSGS
jgi:N-formylglutamate deformylase